jgi:hypothetical protein
MAENRPAFNCHSGPTPLPILGKCYLRPKLAQRVWWDEDAHVWQTSFPPPEGFAGAEQGAFGEDDYARDLTLEEEEAVEIPHRLETARRVVKESAERDRWFAALAEDVSGEEMEGQGIDPGALLAEAPPRGKRH